MRPVQHPFRDIRGELLPDEPLSRHTTWRVGGPARWYFRPADRQDLANLLAQLEPGMPLLWLGLGSNLLVRDGGFPGMVIAMQGRLEALYMEEAELLYAEAGVACAKVARYAARQGLCGLEFLAGIPGTLGGALAMNAGAFGGETWTQVVEVETIDREGVEHSCGADAYRVGYRSVSGPAGEWFLAARMRLQPGAVEQAQERIRQLLAERNQRQPIGEPSCGSVFRNPPGDHAARLIEQAGLKGHRIGGAQVSEKHANFIINTGNARAAEIEQLLRHVAKVVEQRSGVHLQPEVRIVGEESRT